MEGVMDDLLVAAARVMKGRQRRMFLAQVCKTLCDGSPRKTEERFGWGRETVAKGWRDHDQSEPPLSEPVTSCRGRQRSEDRNRQLSIDIRLIVEPHTHSDPELKTERQYTNLSAAEVRLIYYPPYHSKYNPIERCWASLQKKWNGVLLTCWGIVRTCALRMTWKGRHPEVDRIEGDYPTGVIVPKAEMKLLNLRIERSPTLPKYDITIKPKRPRGS